MSKLETLEAEIRTISREDAKKLQDWLSQYLEGCGLPNQTELQTDKRPKRELTEADIRKWQGKFSLPVGNSVDEYLRIVRDGDSD